MQLIYIFREGFSGFRRAKLSMFAAITTICVSLLLLGTFSVLVLNANSVVESLREKVEMEAFLADYLSPVETSIVRDSIALLPGVREVRYVSKEDAATIFKEEFGEDIHRVLDFNPLPASIKIFLKDGYRTTTGAEGVYEAIKNIKGVDDVIYRKTLLEMLDRRATTFLWLIFGIGLFITISSVFLVANTIRLAIYAKRKIIQTMKLIGATKSFVRGPFILEGLVQGFVGGGLAAAILFLVFEYLAGWISIELAGFVHVKPFYYGVVVAVGCVLGFVGSTISIRRFISESVVYE
ncbi:MAG: Cell division protein FtsX [Bacteroidetes bacterium]|jgi:cell division transport system permease protein|nr:Cell division protein FtsX [Bacteroidota bacterium]MDP2886774.1 permease-like cell division protein FtsX [Ignavibacteria bacterium]